MVGSLLHQRVGVRLAVVVGADPVNERMDEERTGLDPKQGMSTRAFSEGLHSCCSHIQAQTEVRRREDQPQAGGKCGTAERAEATYNKCPGC